MHIVLVGLLRASLDWGLDYVPAMVWLAVFVGKFIQRRVYNAVY